MLKPIWTKYQFLEQSPKKQVIQNTEPVQNSSRLKLKSHIIKLKRCLKTEQKY